MRTYERDRLVTPAGVRRAPSGEADPGAVRSLEGLGGDRGHQADLPLALLKKMAMMSATRITCKPMLCRFG